MPGWMQAIARGNPVNWALSACRSAIAGDPSWPSVLTHGGALLALAAAVLWLSTRTFRAYQRAV
jgi:ABC-2 type transport system permease protein